MNSGDTGGILQTDWLDIHWDKVQCGLTICMWQPFWTGTPAIEPLPCSFRLVQYAVGGTGGLPGTGWADALGSAHEDRLSKCVMPLWARAPQQQFGRVLTATCRRGGGPWN